MVDVIYVQSGMVLHRLKDKASTIIYLLTGEEDCNDNNTMLSQRSALIIHTSTVHLCVMTNATQRKETLTSNSTSKRTLS